MAAPHGICSVFTCWSGCVPPMALPLCCGSSLWVTLNPGNGPSLASLYRLALSLLLHPLTKTGQSVRAVGIWCCAELGSYYWTVPVKASFTGACAMPLSLQKELAMRKWWAENFAGNVFISCFWAGLFHRTSHMLVSTQLNIYQKFHCPPLKPDSVISIFIYF